jgi:hypothetical protein
MQKDIGAIEIPAERLGYVPNAANRKRDLIAKHVIVA